MNEIATIASRIRTSVFQKIFINCTGPRPSNKPETIAAKKHPVPVAESQLKSYRAASGVGFDEAWNLAACLAVNRFLAHLKIGRPPEGRGAPTVYDHLVATMGAEDACAERFRSRGVPPGLGVAGTGGPLIRFAGRYPALG